jgi:hypothetical protein
MDAYIPTTRERLLQEIVRSQVDADRIRRERRARHRAWRNTWLYPRLLGAVVVLALIVGLLDWESWL